MAISQLGDGLAGPFHIHAASTCAVAFFRYHSGKFVLVDGDIEEDGLSFVESLTEEEEAEEPEETEEPDVAPWEIMTEDEESEEEPEEYEEMIAENEEEEDDE